jgi:hypothetical protein
VSGRDKAVTTERKKFKIIDDPSVRESYANKLISASFDGGAVVLTLGTTRLMPEDTTQSPKQGSLPHVHVTTRLAISPGGAVELTNALTNMLKTLSEIQKRAVVERTTTPNKIDKTDVSGT